MLVIRKGVVFVIFFVDSIWLNCVDKTKNNKTQHSLFPGQLSCPRSIRFFPISPSSPFAFLLDCTALHNHHHYYFHPHYLPPLLRTAPVLVRICYCWQPFPPVVVAAAESAVVVAVLDGLKSGDENYSISGCKSIGRELTS